MLNRHFSIAPMMAYTDKHFRYFCRLLSPNSILYTEMVHANALIHRPDIMAAQFDPSEQPVVLQLGGSEPDKLAQAAIIAQQIGFKEINLNIGCPSERVQAGSFGACLMAEPQLVADCVAAMQAAVSAKITVKTRIGIDDSEDYAFLKNFVTTVAAAGCQHFIVHARKAWLKGLNPKQNREIPPLHYPTVYQLKQDFPDLWVGINGGIVDVDQVKQHLAQVDEVMVGRQVYHDPYWLTAVEQQVFAAPTVLTRSQALARYLPYACQQLQAGESVFQVIKPLLALYKGQPRARQWRRLLTEQSQAFAAKNLALDALLASLEPSNTM